jgi:hypothetical protein
LGKSIRFGILFHGRIPQRNKYLRQSRHKARCRRTIGFPARHAEFGVPIQQTVKQAITI